MSINCALNEMGLEPQRLKGEYFILKRYDTSYKISLQSNKHYEGQGYMILTSNRLVIIPINKKTQFSSIEIPLKEIYKEQFKQPLFGKHYLTAKCNPIIGSPFGSFTFTIWFKIKKNSSLIGMLYSLIDSLRNNQGIKHDDRIINLLKENNFNEIFPINSEEISNFYKIQPEIADRSKKIYHSEIIIKQNQPLVNNLQNNSINNNLNNNRIILKDDKDDDLRNPYIFQEKENNNNINNKLNHNFQNIYISSNLNNNIIYNQPYQIHNFNGHYNNIQILYLSQNNMPGNRNNIITNSSNISVNQNININSQQLEIKNPYEQIIYSVNNNNIKVKEKDYKSQNSNVKNINKYPSKEKYQNLKEENDVEDEKKIDDKIINYPSEAIINASLENTERSQAELLVSKPHLFGEEMNNI